MALTYDQALQQVVSGWGFPSVQAALSHPAVAPEIQRLMTASASAPRAELPSASPAAPSAGRDMRGTAYDDYGRPINGFGALPDGMSVFSPEQLGQASPSDLIQFTRHSTDSEEPWLAPAWLAKMGGGFVEQAPGFPGTLGYKVYDPVTHAPSPYFYSSNPLRAPQGFANTNPEDVYATPWNSTIPDPGQFQRLKDSPLVRQALNGGHYSLLNGQQYDILDKNGNVTGQGTYQGLRDTHDIDQMVGLAAATIATMGAASAASAGAAGGASAGGAGAGAGAGAAGAGAGAGAGALDLGGGLTMAADGSILGGTGALVPATAGEMSAMGGLGASGAGIVGGGTALGAGSFGSGAAPSVTGLPFSGGSMPQAGMSFSSGLPVAEGMPLGTSFGTGALGMDSALAQFGSAAGLSSLPNGAPGTPGGGGAGAGSASSLIPGISNDTLAKLGITAAGGLLGSQGTQNSATQARELPEFLKGPVGDLTNRTQGLLASQMPQAQQVGSQLISQGQGLLARPVAGNGFYQVKLDAPNTPTNPYLAGMADDIQRRTQEMLAQNNQAIRGNAVGVGGMGGSRQGVAEGLAAGKSADYLSGQLAGLYGNAYQGDQNRSLQKYGMDQSFFANQRGQDLAQVGVGGGLLSQGFQTQFDPLKNASQIYSPFSGMGSTTTSQSGGGGFQGALGGAMAAASLGKQMNWW